MSTQYDHMQANPVDPSEHPDTNMPSSEYWGAKSVSSQIDKLDTNMRANEMVRSNRGTKPTVN